MGPDARQTGWLKLVLAPGFGSALIDRLNLDPESLSELPDRRAADLERAGLPAAVVRAIKRPDAGRMAACETWLARPGHHLVSLDDALYPPLLRRLGDAPLALFVNGRPDWLPHPQIAIVGSRNATSGGCEIARRFATEFSRCGLIVTSGLAAGIDAAAHRAALDAGGVTLAVGGTGPDQVYPARHRPLALEIVDNGAVISMFAPGVGPRPGHFPARNRIISGMSVGVVVIEAGTRSGSLITARLAAEQGREVFAVPGSIRNPMVRGCHQLIRDGARLVESPEEVVSAVAPLIDELAGELRGLLNRGADEDAASRHRDHAGGSTHDPDPDDDQTRQLLDAVGHDPTSVDEIIQRTHLTTQAVSSMLLSLELSGRVAAHGGGRYSRTGKDQESP